MRTLLSSCCLISLALTGFGQTNGTRILQTVIEGGDTSQLPPQARAYLPWFREFLTFDPLAVMRRVRQPALILQGAPDRQVTADHAALLERAARESGIRDVTCASSPDSTIFSSRREPARGTNTRRSPPRL